MDSPWNNDPNDNNGGQPGSPADDEVGGDGTGMVGDGVAPTDQDNHDPLLVEISDLALRKTIADTLGDAILNFGDTIKFAIQIFNQGNTPVDSIIVTDSLYTGFVCHRGFKFRLDSNLAQLLRTIGVQAIHCIQVIATVFIYAKYFPAYLKPIPM
ncbi:MAG: hypothetical protein IPO25_22895 [Saprospiraceae bacterium]|nr:hypothetical protein [Saprospiraceae bacterium]